MCAVADTEGENLALVFHISAIIVLLESTSAAQSQKHRLHVSSLLFFRLLSYFCAVLSPLRISVIFSNSVTSSIADSLAWRAITCIRSIAPEPHMSILVAGAGAWALSRIIAVEQVHVCTTS